MRNQFSASVISNSDSDPTLFAVSLIMSCLVGLAQAGRRMDMAALDRVLEYFLSQPAELEREIEEGLARRARERQQERQWEREQQQQREEEAAQRRLLPARVALSDELCALRERMDQLAGENPDKYHSVYCPISRLPMLDPVCIEGQSLGHVFDRDQILNCWHARVGGRAFNPKTNLDCSKDLVPAQDANLLALISELRAEAERVPLRSLGR